MRLAVNLMAAKHFKQATYSLDLHTDDAFVPQGEGSPGWCKLGQRRPQEGRGRDVTGTTAVLLKTRLRCSTQSYVDIKSVKPC